MTTRKTSITRQIRPLGTLEILDEVFDLYRSHFLLFFGTAAVPYLPVFVLSCIATEVFVVTDGVMASIVIPLMTFAQAGVVGAITYGVSRIYTGHHTSIIDCYRSIVKRGMVWRIVCIFLLKFPFVAGSFIGVGVACYSIPKSIVKFWNYILVMPSFIILSAIWFVITFFIVAANVRLMFAEPVCILEAKGCWSSLRRSWKLSRGFVLRILWALCALTLIMAIPTVPFFMSIHKIVSANEKLDGVVYILADVSAYAVACAFWILLAPITAIAAALLYYDIRVRKEGFDLELLAAQLNVQPQANLLPGAATLPREHVISDEDRE